MKSRSFPLVQAGDRGRYVLYRLSKRGMGTLEAVEAICRRWNLAGYRLSYGGLKDRHAVTIQYLTILEGPERTLRETSFELVPLGRIDRAYGPALFRGNRFTVVIRDLTNEAAEKSVRGNRRNPTRRIFLTTLMTSVSVPSASPGDSSPRPG